MPNVDVAVAAAVAFKNRLTSVYVFVPVIESVALSDEKKGFLDIVPSCHNRTPHTSGPV